MDAMLNPAVEQRETREIVFRLVAAAVAVLLLALGGIGLLAPWLDLSGYHAPAYHAEIYRWYDAQWGALTGLLIDGCLIALIWRPRAQPLLAQFLALVAIGLSAVGAPFDPLVLALVGAPLALCVAAYPARRALLDGPRRGRWSVPLLALTLAAAAALAPDGWHAFRRQLAGADVHPQYQHWAGASMLALALTLAGALAATKRPGWLALGLLAGAALIYLGLAAVMLPDLPGSWGATGGGLATVGGWAYVCATLWEARRERRCALA